MLAHSGAFSVLTGAHKGPFGLTQALTRRKALEARFMARFGPYSLLSPIGLTGLESWLPHTLAWYWDSSWPPGALKGPVLPLLGVLEVL